MQKQTDDFMNIMQYTINENVITIILILVCDCIADLKNLRIEN